jgi:phosphoribosylformylglycinamidine synthase
MAEGAGLGIALDTEGTGALFGEDQARYLVACSADQAKALATAGVTAGVPVAAVGRFGGTMVRLGSASAPFADLSALYRSAFAAALAV